MHNLGKNFAVTMLLGLLTLILMPSVVFASVAGEVNKANDLYRQGQFDDSLDLYQEALGQDDKSPVVEYDLGTALYKKGDYTKALGYLSQAAQDKNIKIKPKAEYNLGNALYKSGIQKENTNVDQAIKSLQEALGHYGRSIADDPKDDQDAVFNQDFVKKEIERLKQKKEQQKQQQQQNQKQQQDQQNKQDQKNQQDKQDQQNQQGQQNKQGQQDQQKKNENQQSKSNKQSGSKEQQQKNALDQAENSQKELDRKAAQDLLEDYQENEEPKKLLSYMPKKIDDRPVLKDW